MLFGLVAIAVKRVKGNALTKHVIRPTNVGVQSTAYKLVAVSRHARVFDLMAHAEVILRALHVNACRTALESIM